MPIEAISDTALITAYARAIESRSAERLLNDPWAERLAGPRGAHLAEETDTFGSITKAVACRSVVVDELITEVVQREHANGTSLERIVNLGAGLDSRPWRLELPPGVEWLDVDLAGPLDYKRAQVEGAVPRCRYRQRALDLCEPEGLGELVSELDGRSTLILSEGLLVYMSVAQVEALASALVQQRGPRWWITDMASPRALSLMERHWGELLRGAQLQFAPANAVLFFRSLGWEELVFRSSQEEAQRLGRAPPLKLAARLLLAALPRGSKEELRRLSGVMLMRRIESPEPAGESVAPAS